MSVSANKGATPSGLDQALHLLEVVKDPAKYTELLEPLKESAAKAREAWQKVELAGDIHALRAQAAMDRDKAAEELAQAGVDIQEKNAALEREYSTKMANLRQREQDFAAEQSRKTDDLQAWETRLNEMSAKLGERSDALDSREAQLDADHEQLKKDRAAVEARFTALKEAFNG